MPVAGIRPASASWLPLVRRWPTALPDPAGLRNKSVLLVAGNADVNAAKGLSEFQDRAAKEGNAAALFLQAGAGHMAASGTTERNRARQFAKFLTEQ
jgi:hypothetical protein